MKKTSLGFLGFITGCLVTTSLCSAVLIRERNQQIAKINKFRTYYDVLNQWMLRKNAGETTADFLKKKQIGTIAIYGMGELGARLSEELKNTSIHIAYCMDSKQMYMDTEGNALPEGIEPEHVDAVIVTAVFAYEEIRKSIKNKIACPIISLEDIVFDYE